MESRFGSAILVKLSKSHSNHTQSLRSRVLITIERNTCTILDMSVSFTNARDEIVFRIVNLWNRIREHIDRITSSSNYVLCVCAYLSEIEQNWRQIKKVKCRAEFRVCVFTKLKLRIRIELKNLTHGIISKNDDNQKLTKLLSMLSIK